jgi:hypothetical protein
MWSRLKVQPGSLPGKIKEIPNKPGSALFRTAMGAVMPCRLDQREAGGGREVGYQSIWAQRTNRRPDQHALKNRRNTK